MVRDRPGLRAAAWALVACGVGALAVAAVRSVQDGAPDWYGLQAGAVVALLAGSTLVPPEREPLRFALAAPAVILCVVVLVLHLG